MENQSPGETMGGLEDEIEVIELSIKKSKLERKLKRIENRKRRKGKAHFIVGFPLLIIGFIILGYGFSTIFHIYEVVEPAQSKANGGFTTTVNTDHYHAVSGNTDYTSTWSGSHYHPFSSTTSSSGGQKSISMNDHSHGYTQSVTHGVPAIGVWYATTGNILIIIGTIYLAYGITNNKVNNAISSIRDEIIPSIWNSKSPSDGANDEEEK